MIELSIVLLILSLLVGSLLVGRQIVDRAKIQRIIFEFDYYEKVFHQFYDTYRSLPGHLSKKQCEKLSEFTSPYTCPPRDVSNMGRECRFKPEGYITPANAYCEGISLSIGAKKVLATDYEGVMPSIGDQLKLSGLIKSKPGELTACSACAGETANGTRFYNARYTSGARSRLQACNWLISWYFELAKANSITKSTIKFYGWNFERQAEMCGSGKWQYNLFYTSNKYYNSSLPHEFDDELYRKNIQHKNTIVLQHAAEDNRYTDNVWKKNGALSAKISSDLDAKIDDGRPATGKFVALKSGYAHERNTSQETHNAVCYDKPADNVSRAIYVTSNDLKYGCNIIKVMEDVK